MPPVMHAPTHLYPIERSRAKSLAFPRRSVSRDGSLCQSVLETSILGLVNTRSLSIQSRPSISRPWSFTRSIDRLLNKIELDGVRQFMEAKAVLAKVLWLTLFAAASVILVYEISKAVRDYKNSPITTTYRIHTPNVLDFPDVYICYATAFNRTYVRSHLEEVVGVKQLFQSVVTAKKRRKRQASDIDRSDQFPDAIDFADWFGDAPPETRYDHLASEINSILSNSIIFDEDIINIESQINKRIRRSEDNANGSSAAVNQYAAADAYDYLLNVGFSIRDTFLSCSFGNRKLDCADIVTPILDPNYFLCHLVKMPEDVKQAAAGHGLRLQINTHISLYPAANETAPNKYAGLFVSVSKNFDPTNWLKTVVRSGTLTKIDISAKKIKLLNLESGPLIQPCLENGRELYRIFNTSYSRTACQMDCMLEAFYEKCQCILLMDRNLIRNDVLASSTFCGFNQSSSCLIPKVTKSKEALKSIDDCRRVCNTPCDDWRYDMRSSAAPLHASRYRSDHQTIPLSDLVDLRIGYGRMEYEELAQSPSKTISQLIADCGGHVNLWLAASMISLIETGLMVIACCIYCIYSKVAGTNDLLY